MKSKGVLSFVLAVMLICIFALPAYAAQSIVYENAQDLYDYLKTEKSYNVTLDAGKIILEGDITLEDNICLVLKALTAAEEVTIDLNGKTLSGNPDVAMLSVSKGILNLTDATVAKAGKVENKNANQGFAIGADTAGLLVVKGGNYSGQFALCQQGGEIDIFSGNFNGITSGAMLFSGETNIYGGLINGGLSAISLNGSKLNISGGGLKGEYYGIKAEQGELTLAGIINITGENWDGIFCERIKPVFENVLKGNIAGGRYGICVQGEGLIFNTVDALSARGGVAAVMLENQTKESNIRFFGSSAAAGNGRIVCSELPGMKYKYFTTFTTGKDVEKVDWKDRNSATVAIPGGSKTIIVSSDLEGSLDSASQWAKPTIRQALALGLVPSNLQDNYRNNATRADFCALAVALYETVSHSEISQRKEFADTSDINVQKMGALAVVQGVGEGKFNPHSPISRQEAAIMLANLMNALGQPLTKTATTFADQASIAPWAVVQVGQVEHAGIMDGVGGNNFSAKDLYTKEQSIATMVRIFDLF